ncbi:hypothetical protein TPA0910_60450 [Streptomyces hygroscopicus subsp. sporocinereus]|uniref:Uncharacterized protein n=1 Tax=Streptomyces hygroscopicus TaxID=1912 RepID=A0ABQ3U7N0_STRHY|nr:hypothetical protein TPA0910_60450 [Streptomyces hygroscopicus]
MSREETSRSPPGSGASPQGESSFVVSVRTTFTEPFAGAAGSVGEGEPEEGLPLPDVAGVDVRPPGLVMLSPPDEQPATSNTAAAAARTGVTRGRRTVGFLSMGTCAAARH